MKKYNKYRHASGTDFLSRLIGDEGIKTDIQIKLSPSAIPVLAGSIIIAVIIGIISANAIMKAVKG